MKLREHPYFNHKGLPSWPPAWSYVSGPCIDRPQGEVGILKKVQLSSAGHRDRCFLTIQFKSSFYIGCLFVSDPAFCKQIEALLQDHIDEEIRAVANLDLSHLL